MRLIDDAAGRLLRSERDDLAAVLGSAIDQDFDRTTVCDRWRVRDVMAHMIAVMGHLAAQDAFEFTPAANDLDVATRRDLPPAELMAQLDKAYATLIDSPAASKGALALWIHGGDVREGIGAPEPYCGRGASDAVILLVHASIAAGLPPVDVTVIDAVERGLESTQIALGDPQEAAQGWLRTDTSGLFRIISGRRAELVERDIVGINLPDLLLFH